MTLSTQTSPASPSASTDAPVTVLVADDHPLFRRGLARAINRHRALDLVGEAVDGAEALELIELLRPGVAGLDVRLPRQTGAQGSAAAFRITFRAVPRSPAAVWVRRKRPLTISRTRSNASGVRSRYG